MKFTLEIELGNEAMQTPDDMADILRKLSDFCMGDHNPWVAPNGNKLWDANGNTVGKWQVSA